MPRLRALGQRTYGSRAVTNASNAITSGWLHVPLGELNGLAGAPALRAGEPRTGPETHAQIDSSPCEVEIAAHHAPRRLELQRKLGELLHAPDTHAVGRRRGMVSARHRRPRARTTRTCVHYRHARCSTAAFALARTGAAFKLWARQIRIAARSASRRGAARRDGRSSTWPSKRANLPSGCAPWRASTARGVSLTERAIDGEPA